MNRSKLIIVSLAAGTLHFSLGAATENWKDKTISPVTNPLFFEEPQIRSDVRPIFMHHRFRDDLASSVGDIPLGGDANVIAVELRWAVTDRLALIATKDGYIDFNPDNTLAKDEGFADIGFGVKYALIDDEANEFMLTPGLKFEVPTGNTGVLQGNGDGEWNLFVSAVKGWSDFHLTGSVGARIPNDFDDESAQLHYSLMADYYTCPYFIPLVAVNAYTVLSDGDRLPLKTEGLDLVNFGSSSSQGVTQATVGFGFRSQLSSRLDFGFAYEIGVTNPDDIFDDRYTVDFIFRF